jgi:hypothetical protein
MPRVCLHVLIEINDHDGYCSGSENEYEKRTHFVEAEVPEGTALTDTRVETWWAHVKHLEPKILEDPRQSAYCTVGAEGFAQGLNCHDFRMTILNIEDVSHKVPTAIVCEK